MKTNSRDQYRDKDLIKSVSSKTVNRGQLKSKSS